MSKVAETIKRLVDDRDVYIKIARAMKAFVQTPKVREILTIAEAMSGESITTDSSIYHSQLYIIVTVRDLDGFKDQRLMGILAAFEYQRPKSTDTVDVAANMEREFIFKWKGKTVDGFEPSIRLAVSARAKEDSATCRKVIVGYTEGKPEPIYKLECSDGSETITAADAIAGEKQ